MWGHLTKAPSLKLRRYDENRKYIILRLAIKPVYYIVDHSLDDDFAVWCTH